MFSKTRAPDCAISVLIAERTAGLTPLWMSLATVNPFPSAITEPRMPFVFRRNSLRIFPSCPSMPSSEKLERAAFRRDSLRCIPVPPGSVQYRSLFEQHGSARVRLLDHPEERTLRRPHDQEQLVRPVAHSAQPEDQQPGSDRRGDAYRNHGRADQDGQGDERDGERAKEPLDALFHDEHARPPDVFVHAREREERDGQQARDDPEEGEESDDGPELCHGWSNARPAIAACGRIYLSFRMFSFVTSPGQRGSGNPLRPVNEASPNLERLPAFPTICRVFRFQVAAVSALDLHDFFRRRGIRSRLARRTASSRECLLHVRVDHVRGYR